MREDREFRWQAGPSWPAPLLMLLVVAAALSLCSLTDAKYGPRDRKDPQQVLTWFKGFDIDGDHHLNLKEFALSTASQEDLDEMDEEDEDMHVEWNTKAFFNAGDIDGDGKLSMSELHSLMFEEPWQQGPGNAKKLHNPAHDAYDEDFGFDEEPGESQGRPVISLYKLVESGTVQELREAVEIVASIDAGRNEGECTPLHMALDLVGFRNSNHHLEHIDADQDYEDKIDVLIDNGADLRHECMGRYPLHMATQSRSVRALTKILGNLTLSFGPSGEDTTIDWPSYRHDLQPGGGTPLHGAVYTHGFLIALSKILVGHAGAGKPAQDMRAKGYFHVSQIPKQELQGLHNSLERWGINIPKKVLTNKYTSYNRQELNKYVFNFTSTFTKILLDHGASPNEIDYNGDAPLHLAAFAGDMRSCEMLLDKGADIAKLNHDGFSPLDAAVKGGQEEVVQFLIDAADKRGMHAFAQTFFARHAERGAVERGERSDNARRGVSSYVEGDDKGSEGTCAGGRGGRTGGWRGRCDAEMEIDFCDISEVQATAGDVHQVIEQHFKAGRPLLIRGAVNERRRDKVLSNWTRAGLLDHFGRDSFMVFNQKGETKMSFKMSMNEYLDRMKKYEGGPSEDPPDWLVDFGVKDGHPLVDSHNQIVKMFAGHLYDTEGIGVSNYQFMVAPAHAGASPHFHYHSARLMVYGRARWFLWPVTRAFYSTRGIWDWYKQDYPKLTGADRPFECVQRAGDLMLVPALWGHGVLYLEDTIGMATLFLS